MLYDAALVLGRSRGADGGAVAPACSDEFAPVEFLHAKKFEQRLRTRAHERGNSRDQKGAASLATLAGIVGMAELLGVLR